MANQIPHLIWTFVFIYYVYFAVRLHKNNRATQRRSLVLPRMTWGGTNNLVKVESKLMVMCNSIVIACFLKDMLKWLFGRYWTSTFICHNPSLVDDNVYGFNWFNQNANPAFASFPSGHATVMFSFSTSMWFLFPSLRWLWSVLAAIVVIGQIGMYYHFVSDVLAGAALGSLVALYNYRYWARS